MFTQYKEQLLQTIISALKPLFNDLDEKIPPPVELEIPVDNTHGDLSSNIALKSARLFKKPPHVLADSFISAIEQALKDSPLKTKIARVEVKKPGFINFFFSAEAASGIIETILRQKDGYGQSQIGQDRKVQIEFVSANPTGPLSVAHARQAAVGDALGNILSTIGYQVTKEYYVNDEGNQINLLGRSIQCRALEILGEKSGIPEGGYHGDYIREMAELLMKKEGLKTLEQVRTFPEQKYSQFGVDYLMNIIKRELSEFGVEFDVWSHQSKIAHDQAIKDILVFLDKKTWLYEKEGALWLKTTQAGDDKDRVVRKSDGSYTYLTPDIVYHQDKFRRGFDKVVNIWGPDHHGYIPRLKASVQALGVEPERLNVLIVQLASIYRDGQPVSMSTRRGQYISLQEVMDEVGTDAARFFFLWRHINAHLDFDLTLAKKETPENPVFYIQYAHARIHSMYAKAKEAALKFAEGPFLLLAEPEEQELIIKLGQYPSILDICGQQMDPYALVNYLVELAICFHRFYDKHRVIDPENSRLSGERLALSEASRIVFANGLTLLGISRPERM